MYSSSMESSTMVRLLENVAIDIGTVYDDVGYLGAGFDYFSKGFVHTPDQKEIEADQDRTRRALSNALFTFSVAPL